MSTLTKQFLEDIGIQLDDATYQAFAMHFDNTLNDRIIDEVIDSLDDSQLEQFSQMREGDGEQMWQWVQANVPELGDIIQDEVDILLGDLAENANHI